MLRLHLILDVMFLTFLTFTQNLNLLWFHSLLLFDCSPSKSHLSLLLLQFNAHGLCIDLEKKLSLFGRQSLFLKHILHFLQKCSDISQPYILPQLR